MTKRYVSPWRNPDIPASREDKRRIQARLAAWKELRGPGWAAQVSLAMEPCLALPIDRLMQIVSGAPKIDGSQWWELDRVLDALTEPLCPNGQAGVPGPGGVPCADVRGIRIRAGLSRKQLAKLCGVHFTTIHRWEKAPDRADWEKLRAALAGKTKPPREGAAKTRPAALE